MTYGTGCDDNHKSIYLCGVVLSGTDIVGCSRSLSVPAVSITAHELKGLREKKDLPTIPTSTYDENLLIGRTSGKYSPSVRKTQTGRTRERERRSSEKLTIFGNILSFTNSRKADYSRES